MADADVDSAWVPGAFEMPLVAKRLANAGKYDAVICLGAVIRGSTPHFDYVAGETAKGIAKVSLDTGVPVVFGVLTTDTIEQAVERGRHEGRQQGLVGGGHGAGDGQPGAHTALRRVRRCRAAGENLGALSEGCLETRALKSKTRRRRAL